MRSKIDHRTYIAELNSDAVCDLVRLANSDPDINKDHKFKLQYGVIVDTKTKICHNFADFLILLINIKKKA